MTRRRLGIGVTFGTSIRVATLATLGGLGTLTGCADAGARSDFVVRDSAGITIVENAAPGEAVPSWSLGDAPALVIGALEGRPEEQLYRVSGAVRLADGRIAIANGGTNEIRLFDASGGYLETVGRDGEGPGEFRSLSALFAFQDSLFATDTDLLRVSALGADGVFARSFPFPRVGERSWAFIADIFDDGTLLVFEGRVFYAGEETSGVVRDSSAYYRINRAGIVVDTIGRFPGPDAYVHAEGGTMMVRSLLFGRSPSATVAGTRFYYGTGDPYEVRIFSGDGALERVVRLDRPPRAVTPADVELAKAQERDEVTDANFRALRERVLEAMPIPSTMPAFSDLEVDADGNLWVQSYRPPGEVSNTWTVFDPEGRLLAEVEMPARLTVFEIGTDWMLGRRTDDLEVERVELYRISRGNP